MTTHSLRREFARTRATGADVRAVLQSSARWLSANAERVNALNVFPVPDGDTGTNMSMTLEAAVANLDRLGPDPTPAQVSRATSEAALLGARGNSGVILSQLLRGFAEALAGADQLTSPLLGAALTRAAEVAYAGVSRPVEGTILTAARVAGEAAVAAAEAGQDLPGVLEATLAATTQAVADTPNQLEILKKAGVVDSGADGYRVILEAAWMFSTGRSLELANADLSTTPLTRADLHDIDAHETGFGFCTEVLVRDAQAPLADISHTMETLGDSVIVVGDPSLVRVHVHTPRPGQVLEYAVDTGTLVKVKVDNMQLQRDAFAESNGRATTPNGQPTTTSGVGVIAVVAGDGLQNVFKSLGASVVAGGQTMNPSVQAILTAVNNAPHDQLIILPNNSNVVLTARQVNDLTSRTVSVIATESAPEGIGALLAFNYESDLSTNVEAMQAAAHAVHTVEVTRAVRDTELDGVRVHAGDMLGLYDGRLVESRETAEDALLGACQAAPTDALEIVTIYYGADATETQARAAAAQLRSLHPGLGVEVVAGGQPHYPYIVSLE